MLPLRRVLVYYHPIDSYYDSPLTNQRFSSTNVLWLLDTRKGAIKKWSPCVLLFCKGPSNDDVGVARGTVFQEVRPGAGFKSGDFVERTVGGATVGRLRPRPGQRPSSGTRVPLECSGRETLGVCAHGILSGEVPSHAMPASS